MVDLQHVLDGATDTRLDHVGLLVRDLQSSVTLYKSLLDMEFIVGGENTFGALSFAHYGLPGGGTLEFISPSGDGGLMRRLDEHGEGFHHLAFRVDSVASKVDALRSDGLDPRGVRLDGPLWKEAFLMPQDAAGVLMQFLEFGDELDPLHHLQLFPTEESLLQAALL